VIWNSRNRSALFKDLCRALLGNESYCLVWIGLPDEKGTDVLPVSADGSTTMNRKECEICMSVLLTDAEEKGIEYNPAAAALRKRLPVVHRDILADIPRGLLKETPLAAGYAACAAFPLIWREKIHGVLSIYSTSKESFQPGEMDLLEAVAAEISLALSLNQEREARESGEELLLSALKILRGGMLTISAGGIILESRRVCEQFGCREDGVGREWQSVLQPGGPGEFERNEPVDLLHSLTETDSVEMRLCSGEIRRSLRCRFVKVVVNGEGEHLYYCFAWDANGEQTIMAGKGSDNFLQLAVLGELSTGMAHEIGDLNNGMINYAQALADELGLETLPPEQRDIFERIFAGGERIAGVVSKLIYYGHETECGSEFKQVQQVLDDALALYGNQLKNDGIQVELQLPEELPRVQVKAQKMLVVFLQLFGNARRALNKRYPQRDAGKRLDVRGEVVGEAKEQQLDLLFTDHGSGLHPEELPRIFDPDFFPRIAGGWGGQSLALSREIVGKHGGTISLESEPDNFTTVRLSLPV
jgi:signal transduction histidine kinase